MIGKRNKCDNHRRFQEHSIGAGLTRKICILCGFIQIGQARKAVLAEDHWADEVPQILAHAG